MDVGRFISGREESPRRDRRIIILHVAWKEGIRHPNANLRLGNGSRREDVS
jgi:hypothetical protein